MCVNILNVLPEKMMFHKKRIAFLIGAVFFTILCVYFLKPKAKHVHTNIFEEDLYGDGDYDEKAKDDLLRKHLIDYPIIDFQVKKETLRPRIRPIVPKIVIKKNLPLSLNSYMSDLAVEENFFRYLETKDVICKEDKRLGYQHDGGYNVCFSPPFGLKKPCLVYSFGIYDDWKFDDAVSKMYKCRVFAFDPSVSIPSHNRSALINFRKIGIGAKNEINKQGWTMRTFGTILKMDGNSHRLIDYLKIDIEYNEWVVLNALQQEGSLRNVKQIGFELHTNELFRDANVKEAFTTKQDYITMYQIIKNLERLNFKQFNYRKNPFGEFKSKVNGEKRSCCYELHFINMNFVDESRNYTIYER